MQNVINRFMILNRLMTLLVAVSARCCKIRAWVISLTNMQSH